jgi:hypothetical protein
MNGSRITRVEPFNPACQTIASSTVRFLHISRSCTRNILIWPKAATANSNSHTFIQMAVTGKSTLKSGGASTKRQNENLTRRVETLFVSSHEIWERHVVDVAVIVMKGGRYFTYSTRPSWLPSKADIVCHTTSPE